MQASPGKTLPSWRKLLNAWPSLLLLAATVLFTALPALSAAH
ncbi:hypothetical protein SAMN05216212_2612 [Microbulbifer yueqingensis]|uniref:Uncharacterized protein n=1 Tax=Microbulbifer yueqingensis TaxID=658219 RepID=A0A1G9CSJ0_9GAMM|nr:hypothetical protein SAMN05216212_2612 [Microbulbifer yueqingensis]